MALLELPEIKPFISKDRNEEKIKEYTLPRKNLYSIHSEVYDIIISVILSYFNFTFEQINVKSRKQEIRIVRQLIMYFGKRKTILSWQLISDVFKKNHATAMSAVKRINNMCETDIAFNNLVKDINLRIDNTFENG